MAGGKAGSKRTNLRWEISVLEARTGQTPSLIRARRTLLGQGKGKGKGTLHVPRSHRQGVHGGGAGGAASGGNMEPLVDRKALNKLKKLREELAAQKHHHAGVQLAKLVKKTVTAERKKARAKVKSEEKDGGEATAAKEQLQALLAVDEDALVAAARTRFGIATHASGNNDHEVDDDQPPSPQRNDNDNGNASDGESTTAAAAATAAETQPRRTTRSSSISKADAKADYATSRILSNRSLVAGAKEIALHAKLAVLSEPKRKRELRRHRAKARDAALEKGKGKGKGAGGRDGDASSSSGGGSDEEHSGGAGESDDGSDAGHGGAEPRLPMYAMDVASDSGSESGSSDVAVDPFIDRAVALETKKNRMGQRARRALAEKLYGDEAKHVKEEKAKAAAKAAARGKGKGKGRGKRVWPSSLQGQGGDAPPAKRAHMQQPQQQQQHMGMEKEKEKTAEELHPSWAAKKAAKEREAAVKPFEGTKLTFD